jgi:choline kinase
MEKKTLAIMAAGFGTRFGGLKQLHAITDNGYSIIDFSIYDAIQAGFNNIVFIVRESILEEFKMRYEKTFPDNISVEFVIQNTQDVPADYLTNAKNRTKPWGTGHVLLILKDYISENFALINADDLYGRQAFELLYDALFNSACDDNYFVGYRLDKTLSENGTVSRGECFVDRSNYLEHVTERHKIEQLENSKVVRQDDESDNLIEIDPETTVSMNFWGFTPDIFKYAESQFEQFLNEHVNSEKAEFYIPTVVEHVIKTNVLKFKMLSTDAKWYGITYRSDHTEVTNYIAGLIDNGEYPEKLW